MSRAAAALVLLHLAVALAGFLAPYHYGNQNRAHALAPLSRVHLRDGGGNWHWPPFVYRWVSDNGRDYREDTTTRYPIRFLVECGRPHLGGMIRSGRHLFGVTDPGRIFLLGTDSLGRDGFSRLLHGGRISLAAGLGATVLSLSLAVVLGGLAGYWGGWLDELIMRTGELFLALPWLYLLLAARAFLPLDVAPWKAFFLVLVLLGLVGWAAPTRLVRGIVLSAKERDFVHAGRAFGASHWYLLRVHVMPGAFGVLQTQAAVLIPQYVLAEVTLSFVGLGVGEPLPSWGNMLAELQQYHVLSTAWWMFAPGVALVAVSWSYHALVAATETRWPEESI